MEVVIMPEIDKWNQGYFLRTSRRAWQYVVEKT